MPEPGKIKKKKPHRFYDYSLLFTIIFLTVFGLIMIYSASSYKAQLDYGNPGYFMLRQAGVAGVSFVAMYIVSKIDYHWVARFAMRGYIVSYVTLLLTRFTPLGVASHGKKRWLRLGPLQFQPTEIVKISLILLLAVLIANLGVRINQVLPVFDKATWTVLVVTVLGVVLAMTPFGKLKGTEEISNAMLYIVIALIASRADLSTMGNAHIWLAAGILIIVIHVAVMVILAKVLKMDIFTCAVASLANIGGTATAPVLAGAYSSALVPVGIVMALLGYVIGTGGGLLVANLMRLLV